MLPAYILQPAIYLYYSLQFQHNATQKQIQMHDRPGLVITLYSSLLVEAPLLGSATHHQPQHGTTAKIHHTVALP